MQKALGPGAIPTYHPLLEIETHALLRRLLDDSGNYDSQIRRYVYERPKLVCPTALTLPLLCPKIRGKSDAIGRLRIPRDGER